jgi:hypothetical protein
MWIRRFIGFGGLYYHDISLRLSLVTPHFESPDWLVRCTTLRSLALVNHAFYAVALSYIYEHAEIKIFDYASLQLAVDKVSTENCRLHMRRLDIMTSKGSGKRRNDQKYYAL